MKVLLLGFNYDCWQKFIRDPRAPPWLTFEFNLFHPVSLGSIVLYTHTLFSSSVYQNYVTHPKYDFSKVRYDNQSKNLVKAKKIHDACLLWLQIWIWWRAPSYILTARYFFDRELCSKVLKEALFLLLLVFLFAFSLFLIRAKTI